MSFSLEQLPNLTELTEAERATLVEPLLELVLQQQEKIRQLEEEIQELKKLNKRPKLRPSKMDQQESAEDAEGEKKERKRGKPQGSRTDKLIIHESKNIPPEGLPENARAQGYEFKGYSEYTVQDLVIEVHNVCYRLENWKAPDGTWLKGELPESIHGHFGPTLVSYILHQYHHQQVTQPLVLEYLREIGIEISSGQLSNLLIQDKEGFHEEKEALLRAGIEVSSYLQTDDTGARHDGKNGYCTYVGNELFAWFASTESKSRTNFLELLRAEHKDYVINAGALDYMARQGLPKKVLCLLEGGACFADQAQWKRYLEQLGITNRRHIRIATEGALTGSLLAHGFSAQMSILSDDAGQFNVFEHALCWIHAERNILKLTPLNATHRKQQAWVRTQIWDLYADLKAYKAQPDEALKSQIQAHFDELCRTQTDYQLLNQALKRLKANQGELLLVLEKPELPLHNNLSESDIRDYVKRRKISGSTRSVEGRRCRDTFASLKKTCRKHQISFWHYLLDRVGRINAFSPLADYVRQAAAS
jgi:hypothetical protein